MDNKQIISTVLGLDYESIQKLVDCRPCTFDTTREQWWYEIGLIDGAKAADVKYAKLASYEDKTLITDEFLNRNFTYSALSNSWDYSQISISKAKEIDDLYYVNILFGVAVEIKTIGQLRMFLSICGLYEIVEQFKA